MNKLRFVFSYYSVFYYRGLSPELRRVEENYIFSLKPCVLSKDSSPVMLRGGSGSLLSTLAVDQSLRLPLGDRQEIPLQRRRRACGLGEESGRGMEGTGLRDGPGLIPEGGTAMRSKLR